MKAVGLTQYLPIDNPDSLVDLEIPTPEPTGRELRVRVYAVSVNPVDVKMRAPGPDKGVLSQPLILGFDAAGVVEAVGPAVTLFKPGDEVYYAGSNDRAGSNREFHLVDERIVGTKPHTDI